MQMSWAFSFFVRNLVRIFAVIECFHLLDVVVFVQLGQVGVDPVDTCWISPAAHGAGGW